jgi:hypothetical protein
MLCGAVDERIFVAPADPSETRDAKELLRHGVLPVGRKRKIFLATLEQVVLPGLEQFGIDAARARAWLRARGGITEPATPR